MSSIQDKVRESVETYLGGASEAPKPRGRAAKAKQLHDRYAKAYDDCERIATELARVQNRWQKARKLVARLDKELDKVQREQE